MQPHTRGHDRAAEVFQFKVDAQGSIFQGELLACDVPPGPGAWGMVKFAAGMVSRLSRDNPGLLPGLAVNGVLFRWVIRR